MTADVNRVTLTARLTREPEVRRTQSGTAIMAFGIAFNDRRKNAQTGEWEDQGNFADCVLFGARAESLANFLHKGSRVAIDGKLRWSQWEREGQKRSKLEITVDDLVMLDPRQNNQGGAQGSYGQQAGGYAYGGGNAPQAAPQQPQGGYGYGQPQPAPQQQGGYQQPQQQHQRQAQAAPQQAPSIDASQGVYDGSGDIYSDDIPF